MCLMQGGVKRVFERSKQGSDFWQIFPRTHSSCLLEPWGYAQGTREGSFTWTKKSTQYIVHFTTFRVPSTVLRYGGVEFWCSLLADLSVGVQTAARAPICPLLCRCSQVTRRKVSLADEQGRTERRTQVNRKEQFAMTKLFDLVQGKMT